MRKNHLTLLAASVFLLFAGYVLGNFLPLRSSKSLDAIPEVKACANLSLSDAEVSVRSESSVSDLIKRNGDIILIRYDRDEEDQMVFQVLEVVQDTDSSHTATYGWFGVNKCTGEVKSRF